MSDENELEQTEQAPEAAEQKWEAAEVEDQKVEDPKVTPDQYFHYLKSVKNTTSKESLKVVIDNAMTLLNKYADSGQHKAASKLIFYIETLTKAEAELIDLGIDTFVYREDIENYIDKVEKDVVKIIEIENFERDIPDEVVNAIKATRHIFTDYYVVFTDYTGKVERQIEKERRAIDPIVFGTIHDETRRIVLDRFYFIGDWEDEYCDLTLSKMIEKYKKIDPQKTIEHKIKTPEDISELKNELSKLERSGRNSRMRGDVNPQEPEEDDGWIVNESLGKATRFFRAIRTIFK